jgi:pyruvate/2-oxoglutarate dehydrogenase complex dihydrolipoamide acyltransferase (E2) component
MAMDRIGSHEMQPFSKGRRDIALLLNRGACKHTIHALLEIDVTEARKRIRKHHAKTGVKLSFTGWIIKCVAEGISRHKTLNAYRHGRRKMVVFDDVDVPIPVERETDGEYRPRAYILRKANEKSVADITAEIRDVQSRNIGATTELLSDNPTPIERFALAAPLCVKRLLLAILRRSAFMQKKHIGTVGVSSIGMYGAFPGWVVPLGIPAILVVVGGIKTRPGMADGRIEPRDMLHVCISFDHDMVDGGPLARFVDELVTLMEGGFGLSDA